MYLPERFAAKNDQDILAVVQENPLATLISVKDQRPFISHIPLVVEKNGAQLKLIGHFAKANPHWKLIEDPVTAIFHGPNSYITPRWYSENDVPTWNYVVVHMSGVGRLLPDFGSIVGCLKKLTDHIEANSKNPWEFWLPADLANPQDLASAIIGFEVDVQDIQAKFKLSQNRSVADRAGVIPGLCSERVDEMSKQIAVLMEQDSSLKGKR